MTKPRHPVPTWEGMNTRKRIAELNMTFPPTVTGEHRLAECLRWMREDPENCLRRGCIIAQLIQALLNRGARL